MNTLIKEQGVIYSVTSGLKRKESKTSGRQRRKGGEFDSGVISYS